MLYPHLWWSCCISLCLHVLEESKIWEYVEDGSSCGREEMLMKFEERWLHVILLSGSGGRKYSKLYFTPLPSFTVHNHTFDCLTACHSTQWQCTAVEDINIQNSTVVDTAAYTLNCTHYTTSHMFHALFHRIYFTSQTQQYLTSFTNFYHSLSRQNWSKICLLVKSFWTINFPEKYFETTTLQLTQL